ncbi:hypothetical protein LN650_21485 [Klebsiella pneumoniae subsp. pneumoniae]|nr:hypothetical protein [Klebsiella pneumoniae subsp. pneumoniae]
MRSIAKTPLGIGITGHYIRRREFSTLRLDAAVDRRRRAEARGGRRGRGR